MEQQMQRPVGLRQSFSTPQQQQYAHAQPQPQQHVTHTTVYVNRNGSEDSASQAIVFNNNATFGDFLAQCAAKLGIKAVRLFDNDGVEVTDIESVRLLDHVWVSSGEAYNRKNSSRKTTYTLRRDNGGSSASHPNTKEISGLYSNGVTPVPSAQDNYYNSNKVQIAMLGRGRVGKSSLAMRYVSNQFQDTYDPTFQDKHLKTDYVENNVYQVEILDTAGEEEYHSVRTMWMQGKDALFFVYSVDDAQSFEEVPRLHLEMQRIIQERQITPAIVIVGNKCDMGARVIHTEKGRQLAQKLNALFFECSAKTGINVEKCFHDTILKVVQMRNERKLSQNKQDQVLPQEKNDPCLKCAIF